MTSLIRIVLVLSLLGFAVFYVVESLHWPLVEDAAVMHYVRFLMAHGMHPYSDITDNNMPGAYLTEGWGMHLFGGSDVGWRIYDFALLAVLAATLILIALPYDWLAGYLAWGMFLLVHAADGPRYTGQREEVIAVLLVISFAVLFEALRRGLAWPALLFGFCSALAVSIKPTFAPLPVAVLVVAVVHLRGRRSPFGTLLLAAAAGMVTVTAGVFVFLVHHDALKNFIFILRVITPAYRAVWPASGFALIVRAYPLLLLPVLLLALALGAGTRSNGWLVPDGAARPHGRWEQAALLFGALAGLGSYYIQHKGFYHHRYTWIIFCFLLCALMIVHSLRGRGWRRHGGHAALLFVSLVCVPVYGYFVHRFTQGTDRTVALQQSLAAALEQDLTTLAAGDPVHRLQRQVLCFDLVSGCLSALYHLQLVESSGFTGDLLFFRKPPSPAVLFYRDLFWKRARQNPPAVLVITTEWFGEADSFDKIDTWPEFAEHLRTDYVQVADRQWPEPGKSDGQGFAPPRAYRIYVKKANDLMPLQHLAATR